jgi:hypothetical protein
LTCSYSYDIFYSRVGKINNTNKGGEMNQYCFEQGNPEVRKVSNELRKAGFKVSCSSIGYQVTNCGLIKTTLMNIYNADGREHGIVNGRDFRGKGI